MDPTFYSDPIDISGPFTAPGVLDPFSDLPPLDLGTTDSSLPSPTAVVAGSTNAPAWSGFLSSLAGDASSLLGGVVRGVQQSQAIQQQKQLLANGYIVPPSAPGLNGAINGNTFMLLALIAVAVFMLAK